MHSPIELQAAIHLGAPVRIKDRGILLLLCDGHQGRRAAAGAAAALEPPSAATLEKGRARATREPPCRSNAFLPSPIPLPSPPRPPLTSFSARRRCSAACARCSRWRAASSGPSWWARPRAEDDEPPPRTAPVYWPPLLPPLERHPPICTVCTRRAVRRNGGYECKRDGCEAFFFVSGLKRHQKTHHLSCPHPGPGHSPHPPP